MRSADADNHLASCALYEIAKIKIHQKDFYEAYFNLKRANFFKLKQKKLVNYKIFTEGVIFLMKRKTKTGLKLISQVVERYAEGGNESQGYFSEQQDGKPDFLENLMYVYRAYANFVVEDYDQCLKDYIKAGQL